MTTGSEMLRLISSEASSEAWMLVTSLQRLIVASTAALPVVDSACGRGLIMRFSWDKVAEAHAGIGALMAGLNNA
jgi:hypothetical protein